MKQTIQTVDPNTRTWDGPNGTIEFVSGQFTDGSGWSLGAKPENKDSRIAELTALIGVEGEFELEAKPDYQGKKQFKLKAWPGKPSFGGGGRPFGGGGGGTAAHRNTAEGQAYEQERMDRRTALMQAVAVGAADDYIDHADEMYKWLRATAGDSTASASTSAAHTGEGVRAAADSEQGSGNRGEAASGPCSHPTTSPLKLDGQGLPKGFVRCVECNALSDKQGVFK